MDREHYNRINEIFQRAFDRPVEERDAFLREACEGDEALLAELLAQFGEVETAVGAAPTRVPGKAFRDRFEGCWESDDPGSSERIPESIAGFRILRRLGEGGMGVVYEAEQETPQRRVAVKIMRPGFVSPSLIGRFRLEAELLGRLQHPGIARVFEAGRARPWGDEGPELPYLVMELVEGKHLTAHAADQGQDTRQRLEVLAKICDAVQHAHERGIIHRDLKPANVLVDASGQPRVLDFGVARALDADMTRHTATAQLVGTLPYMSPEQLTAGPDELGPGSDIYSLGVLGYELLVGHRPLELDELALGEAVRQVQGVEPARLGSLDADLRGDVESIIAKALDKEVTRRYPSCAAMAADIRRYLADKPIHARPPSAVYRALKFVRRNRALTAAVTGLILVLILGAALATRFGLREAKARHLAEQATDAAQRSSYRAELAAALGALHAGDAGKARRHLLQAPEPLREWTWNQAWARLDDSLAQLDLELDDGTVRTLVAGPEGTIVVADREQVVVIATRGGLRVTHRLQGADSEIGSGGRRAVLRHGDRLFLHDLRKADAPSRDLGWVTDDDEYRSDVVEALPTGEWLLLHGQFARLLTPEGDVVAQFGPYEERLTSRSTLRIPHGPWLLVGTDGDEAAAHDLETGRVHQFHRNLRAPAVTPDGRYLLLAQGGMIKRYEVGTFEEKPWPQPIKVDDGPAPMVSRVDPRGERLLTISRSGSVVLWDLSSGVRLGEVTHAAYQASTAWYSPDGSLLVVPSLSGWLRVFDARDGREVHEPRVGHLAVPRSAAWIDDGRRLASLDQLGVLRLFIAPGLSDSHVLTAHSSYVYDLAFSPDGTRLGSIAWDRSARSWDVATGALLGTFPTTDIVGLAVAFDPTGEQLVAAHRHQLLRWDLGSRELLETKEVGARVNGIAFDDARRWAALSGEGRCRLTKGDAFGPELDEQTSPEGTICHADIERSGRLMAFGGGRELSLKQVPTGEVLWGRTDFSERIHRLRFSPDGKTLAVSAGEQVLLIDCRTGATIHEYSVSGVSTFSVAFHPNGNPLVGGGDDGMLRTWDTVRGELIAELPGHKDYVHDLEFSPDGEVLASASGDSNIRLWHSRRVSERLKPGQAGED